MRARVSEGEGQRVGQGVMGRGVWRWAPVDGLLAGAAVLAVMGGAVSPRAEAQPRAARAPSDMRSDMPSDARPDAQPDAQSDTLPRAAGTPSGPPSSVAPGAFSYDGTGRRDPFVSLALKGSDPRSEGRLRYQGLTGVSVGEVTVKGIVLYDGKLVAMVQAPDDRTYIVRPNDRLLDGAVRAVTPEAVVFVQQVNDPLSLINAREIRKPLRVVEEVK